MKSSNASTPGNSITTYRADVDGLRALAVLAVIIYHINEKLLPGGFAGVDIFFGISGFLITGNLHQHMQEGGFTFKDFYRRRLLRLFPPLIIVVFATLLVGQIILLPDDFKALTESGFASILSVANFYFLLFLDTSYFAADASVHPLLHLWSLGVEEQFYLLWPILLLVFFKTGVRGLALITLLIGMVSFALAEFLVRDHPMLAYYMLPTRAGQLMSGALVYFCTRSDGLKLNAALREALALVGLTAVLASLYFIDGDIAYPGLASLPVTLGTAAIILAGTKAENYPIINRLLGIKPLVLIGRLSYSLYLWHWPIFAFRKYLYGSFDILSAVIAVMIALGLSALTYHFVEKNYRRRPAAFPKVASKTLLLPALVAGLIMAGVGHTKGYGLFIFTDYSERLEAQKASDKPTQISSASAKYVCQSRRLSTEMLNDDACIINKSESPPRILLWGDSNAGHFVGTLGAMAGEFGFSFRNAVHAACPPFMEGAEDFTAETQRENCRTSANLVISSLREYDIVMLGAVWSMHLHDENERGRAAFENTVDQLIAQGKEVVVLNRIPIHRNMDRQCSMKQLKFTALNCDRRPTTVIKQITEANDFIERVATTRPKLSVIGFNDLLCPDESCSPYIDKKLAYYNKSHLNLDGSWALGRLFIEKKGLPEGLKSAPLLSPSRITSIDQLRASLDGNSTPSQPQSDDRKIIKLFEAKSGDGLSWSGQDKATVQNDVLLIEDNSASAYAQVSSSFTLSDMNLRPIDPENIWLEAKFSMTESNTPSLNLQTTTHAGGDRKHLLYVIASKSTFRKRQATPLNSIVSIEEDLISLQIKLNLDDDPEISVKIVAAASMGEAKYQKETTGIAALKEVNLYGVEPITP